MQEYKRQTSGPDLYERSFECHAWVSYYSVHFQTLTAAVKSVEDHGYILDLGIPDLSGFLSFKNAEKGLFQRKLQEGWLLDVTITKVSKNKRSCDVSVEPSISTSSHVRAILLFLSYSKLSSFSYLKPYMPTLSCLGHWCNALLLTRAPRDLTCKSLAFLMGQLMSSM